ncbi:MAG: glycosyltransferase [Verrucomicrobia bacterium]|nr:glycosyltransferase [Verrucomicrobiota bacterium]
MLLLHIFILLGLLLIAGNYLLNLKCFRFPRITSVATPPPRLSVLIPARNEELRLRPCISTLSDSDFPILEILILDDHSTDGTAALVQQRAKGDPRIRLISGQPLPQGWVGKPWACHQLSQEAKGDYLLFVDADTRFSDIAISHAVNIAHMEKADLVSLWPFLEARTWSECLVIPFVHLFILFYLPHWARGPLRCFGAANGQFVLFRRDAYLKIRGHESVRNHMVEDIAIARNMRGSGFKVLNFDATNPGHSIALVRCRMYTCFQDVWQGFTKNLYPSFDGNLAAFLLFQSIQILLFLIPFVLLLTPFRGPWVWVEIAIILALRLSLAHRFRQSYLGVLLHPLGQILVLAIAANSFLQTLRRRLPWKGRHYSHGQSLSSDPRLG